MIIRNFEKADWPAVWAIIETVFRAGKTYVYPTQISEEESYRVWVEAPQATFVAEDAGRILGTYFIKPNQPGLGNHVCNCGYIVCETARGRGIASILCGHSQTEAVARGFRGMQFNLVVSSNEGAVRLWQKHGFDIVGTVPQAFRHAELGEVDAYIMHKSLVSAKKPTVASLQEALN